ncbi:MAG TPA: c-type cytochrome [Puia sp.]|nr:c-type cytochrome [Puia sp.]
MFKLGVLSFLSLVVLAFNSLPSIGGIHDRSDQEDSLAADRAKYVKLVLKSIEGKENMRSDSVFKNIKILKMPAARLLKVMELGYSKSLGVSCGHCHNPEDFSSEEKTAKDITRQMSQMNATINNDLLKNITGLENKSPVVNCTTCHRGQLKPALNLSN